MKEKVLIVRITEEQNKILEAKAKSFGFIKKSDYLRFIIFMPLNVHDTIKEIYEKIAK